MTPIRKGTAARLGLRRPSGLWPVIPGDAWLIDGRVVVFDAPRLRIGGLSWRRTRKRLERNMRTLAAGLSDMRNHH